MSNRAVHVNRTFWQYLSDHDANEERRYLYEGKRLNLAWSVTWLVWALAVNLSADPGDQEAWSAWITVGPLTVEVYASRAAEARK